jgi:DNA ligase-1
MTQFKPMLAATIDFPLENLTYPVYVTPKIDGIRALVKDQLVYRSLKPITNKFICAQLAGLPKGLDGELIVRDTDFSDTSGAIRREDGEPNFEFVVFDSFAYPQDSYAERCVQAEQAVAMAANPRVRFLVPTRVDTPEDLQALYEQYLAAGYEGAIVRSRNGKYKYGRATQKEGTMLKLKQFQDEEATVIGFYEFMHNENPAETNELGRTERSAHKQNLVPGNMLGGLELQRPDGVAFRCGTGFDMATRNKLWENPQALIGKLVKYRSMIAGVKDKPRHPVFLGFRDPDDTST